MVGLFKALLSPLLLATFAASQNVFDIFTPSSTIWWGMLHFTKHFNAGAFNSLTHHFLFNYSCEIRKSDVLGLQKSPSRSHWDFHCSVSSIYYFQHSETAAETY